MNEQTKDAIAYIVAVRDTLMAQDASDEIGSLAEIAKQIETSKTVIEEYLLGLDEKDIDEIDKIQIRAEIENAIQDAKIILEGIGDELEEPEDTHDELDLEEVEEIQYVEEIQDNFEDSSNAIIEDVVEEVVETSENEENYDIDLSEKTEEIEEEQESQEDVTTEKNENIETANEKTSEFSFEPITNLAELATISKNFIDTEVKDEVENDEIPEEVDTQSKEKTITESEFVLPKLQIPYKTIQIPEIPKEEYIELTKKAIAQRNEIPRNMAEKCEQIVSFTKEKCDEVLNKIVVENPDNNKKQIRYEEKKEIDERV